MYHVRAAIVGALLFSTLCATGANANAGSTKMTEWNGITIQCKTIGGTIGFDESPEQCLVRMDFGKGVTHSLVVTPQALQLTSDALGIDETRNFEVQGCTDISITATRDSLTLRFEQRSLSSRFSQANSRTSTGPSSTSTSSSSSRSTSESSDVTTFDVANWSNTRIELLLKGGNSTESTIEGDGDRCTIEFNIDKGKNKRTIVAEPGSLDIDGKPRRAGDDYSMLFIHATRDSLKVATDRGVVGQWKGDMSEKVLRD